MSSEGNTGLTTHKIRRAEALLHREGCTQKRYAFVSELSLKRAYSDAEHDSAEYNTLEAILDGRLDYYDSFAFNIISTEGILPKSGNVCSCYFFSREELYYKKSVVEVLAEE